MSRFSLNPEQKAAVAHQTGPALVVAGAGTGKTQVITQRIARLIKDGVKPAQILGVTFTEKAAQEMETRVSNLLNKYILDVNITTFNSFGYDLIRRFSYELGMTPSVQLLSEAQRLVFLRDHLDELDLNYYGPITNPEGMLADLASYFSKLAGELITYEKYDKYIARLRKKVQDKADKLEVSRHQELAHAYRTYTSIKRQQNVIDFDDQIVLPVELLEKYANIRKKLAQEISQILVDEFQDTNAAQSRLVDLLLGPQKNIMVVGDDDQSIYRFRGAAVANILRFLDRYPNAKRITLNKNYRSTQSILDSAYRLIQNNNPERLEAKYKIDKRLMGRNKGQLPQLRTFLTVDEEAAGIAQEIKQRLKAGQAPGEIAILVRKNSQTSTIARYLEAGDIDHHILGQAEDLYRQPEVIMLLNFLRVVTDPHDSKSLYHLLTSEVFKFDPADLRQIVVVADKRHLPLEAALTELETEIASHNRQFSEFLQQLATWRQELPRLGVGQLCFLFLKQTKYLQKLMKNARDDPSLDLRVANLNQFFITLRQFEAIANDNSAVGYIQALPTLIDSGQKLVIEDLPELFDQKVLIMTIHKAKGLEFETVYLFDMTQEVFPGRRQPSSLEVPTDLLPSLPGKEMEVDHHLQEERRLAYVAITRAKKDLMLTYSPDHGSRRARRPSVFIEETLGEQPTLAALRGRKLNIDQIELFQIKDGPAGRKKANLPGYLLNNDTLTLTQKQLDDYIKCPTEFFVRYVMVPPQPTTFALEYGNLMHNLIQHYNRRRLDGNEPSLQQLLQQLQTDWPDEVFVTPGHRLRSLKQARASLKRFWQREHNTKLYPNIIEQAFEFTIDQTAVKVRGRFDAVYEQTNPRRVEIRDYKTGSSSIDSKLKADRRAQGSFQLSLYALAWQKMRGQMPDLLTLDFIDKGWVGQTSKTARQLGTVEDKIVKAAAGIRAGDWRPGSSHLFCTHPDYGL